MKTSNKDLSSLADTTKDATTAKLTDQIDQIDDVQNVDSEESSHPMALIIEDDISSEVNVVSELKKGKLFIQNSNNSKRRNRYI